MPSPQQPLQHAGMRASNLALALGAVADGGPLTRAQIATRTGLTKSSVSGLVSDLVGAGLVVESPAPPARDRGRPGTLVALSPRRVAGLGLEINVDYLAAMLVDLAGVVRYRHVVLVDNRGRTPMDVLVTVGELADAAAKAAAEQRLHLAGACLAVPGAVETRGVFQAPNLGWSDVPFSDALEAIAADGSLAGREALIDNEADLAALGELWFGDAGNDFVHISGEIGIGSGIIVNGELFRGRRGRAGELGHMVLEPDGPECSCGGRGCLERFAGQDAILAAAGAATPDALKARCQDGDDAAVKAVAQASERLGVALASVTNLLDPGAIVLGGLFAELAPWVVDVVGDTLRRHGTEPRLVVSHLGSDAAVRGAAGRVIRSVLADPAAYLN